MKMTSRHGGFERRNQNVDSYNEENGGIIEKQLLGEVDSKAYKMNAYKYLHPEAFKMEGLSKVERYERTLATREILETSFVTVMDLKRDKIPLDIAYGLVEQSQKNNPEEPEKLFARKLLEGVRERFSKEKFIFKFFTTCGGTHVDVCNGIDGFFKVYSRKTGKELAIATIDLTTNPDKRDTPADILMYISKEEAGRLDNSRGNTKFDPIFFEEIISREKERVIAAIKNDSRSRKKDNKQEYK